MKDIITLSEAEEMAKEANINGVSAFIKNHSTEYDRVSIQLLKESLMAAYIAEAGEMNQYVFSNIKRIANL